VLGFRAGSGDANAQAHPIRVVESDLITNSNGESDSISDLLLSTFSFVGESSMISAEGSGVCVKALSCAS
jgi:hypothetical protein